MSTSPAQESGAARDNIVATALRLADREGVGALTMRRLGQEVGVDAMAVHRHVGGKQGLLDALADALWAQLRPPAPGMGWERSLRAVAEDLRSIAHAHPRLFPLMSTRAIMPVPGLRVAAELLGRLETAGYSREVAAEAIRSVLAYAIGYAITELGLLGAADQDIAQQESEIESLVRITQALPPETPSDVVEVASIICTCDMDRQFTFGLELMLNGLRTKRKPRAGKRTAGE